MRETKQVHRLTPEQIENWRNLLLITLGPIALYLSEDKIQSYRDQMQRKANELGKTESA